MSITKYYCLGCERPNNCKCADGSKRFAISYTLRPPLTTKNKVVFRKFLDDCKIFVNMVPLELRDDFLALLRKVKYFNKSINGQDWTNIPK
jgi:hypothetical protein